MRCRNYIKNAHSENSWDRKSEKKQNKQQAYQTLAWRNKTLLYITLSEIENGVYVCVCVFAVVGVAAAIKNE